MLAKNIITCFPKNNFKFSSTPSLYSTTTSSFTSQFSHGFNCNCCTPFISSSPNHPFLTKQRNLSTRQGHPSFTSSLSTDDLDKAGPHIRKLLENNREWAAKQLQNDPTFFEKLGQKQEPKFLYIGCSDSRVPSNQILGLGAGEVFVHRNIGNLVNGNDLNALSVLEYGVGHLNVTDIIITGHYDCGAIRAASKRQDLGTLENWLRQIRDVYRLHKDYLDLITDSEFRHRTLVELNVIEQCLNVYKTGIVQRKRIQTKNELIQQGKNWKEHQDEIIPRIHGMVFDPSDGLLSKLHIDFKKRIGSLDHIYGLYDYNK